MKITYLHHSGFMVELEKLILVFDYFTQGGRFDFIDTKAFGDKEVIFFVTHEHEDHFDKKIGQWAERAFFVVSDEVFVPGANEQNCIMTTLYQTYHLCGAEVTTLKSNDAGVAFLVKAEGKTIYHGGDLNWWHWDGEYDAINEDIGKMYCREIDRLKGEKVDVAFVPADPRLKDKESWAIEYFAKEVGADAIFPMHFWGQFGICQRLQATAYGDKIVTITQPNEVFTQPFVAQK